MLSKTNGIISMTPGADHSEKEGHFVNGSAGKPVVCAAATDKPIGVLLDGEATTGKDTVALCGATSGTCLVKLGGAATKLSHGELVAGGTVKNDTGAGARILCCTFLEDGVEGELVEAAIITPIVIAA
ncbi:MAG: hypothetical protein R6X19_03395 [Kiritimatiellia bacterium]